VCNRYGGIAAGDGVCRRAGTDVPERFVASRHTWLVDDQPREIGTLACQ